MIIILFEKNMRMDLIRKHFHTPRSTSFDDEFQQSLFYLFFKNLTLKKISNCPFETLLKWAVPHLTLTPDLSSIRLSKPGGAGCIDHSGIRILS